MLFPKANRVPPASEGPLLIAEYVQVSPQTEISKLVDAVARHYISAALEQSGRYILRGVGRSMSGDLRTVGFVWEAKSAATAVEVAQDAQKKIDTEALSLVTGVDVKFMKPAAYDGRRGNPTPRDQKVSFGGINIFLVNGRRTYESDLDLPCALHDEILLRDGKKPEFMAVAGELLEGFEKLTGWTFTGAGEDLENPNRLMHFWRMGGLGTIAPAMTRLSDVPRYSEIQGFIVTELQHFYLNARRDLPIGAIPGDPS